MLLDANFPPPGDPSSGMGGDMAALFVVGILLSIGVTAWKVSTARRMARDSGMDQGDATTMALLTDDGLESTYVASNLRHQQPPQPAGPEPKPSTADRLEELQVLRN